MTPAKAASSSNSRCRLVEFSDSAGSIRATRRVEVGPMPGSFQCSVKPIWILEAPPENQRWSEIRNSPAILLSSRAAM
jgi:hypothetical protein